MTHEADWEKILSGLDVHLRILSPCADTGGGSRTEVLPPFKELLEALNVNHRLRPMPASVLLRPHGAEKRFKRAPAVVREQLSDPWAVEVHLQWARGDPPVPVAEKLAAGREYYRLGPFEPAQINELGEVVDLAVRAYVVTQLATIISAYEWWNVYGITLGDAYGIYADRWFQRDEIPPALIRREIALRHLSQMRRCRSAGVHGEAAESSEVAATYFQNRFVHSPRPSPAALEALELAPELRAYSESWEKLRIARRSWMKFLWWSVEEGVGDWFAGLDLRALRFPRGLIPDDMPPPAARQVHGHRHPTLGYEEGFALITQLVETSGPAIVIGLRNFMTWPLRTLGPLLARSEVMTISRQDPWAPDERLRRFAAAPPPPPRSDGKDFERFLATVELLDAELAPIGQRASENLDELDSSMIPLLLRGLAESF